MGRKILITGASTGIGAATAEMLASGNTLYLHYNASASEAQRVLDTVRRNGGDGHLLQADLSTEQGCRSLVDQVAALTDTLDALVNNAGALIRRMPMEEVSWAFMHQVFAVNAFSVLTITTGCAPLLERGTDPCVVNVTTSSVRRANANSISYGAAKGAVDAMTRGMALAYAPKIRVNSVAPGMVDTPFHTKVTSPEAFQASINNIPLRRAAKAAEVAHAIRFLIENGFVTGSAVDVNGGQEMR